MLITITRSSESVGRSDNTYSFDFPDCPNYPRFPNCSGITRGFGVNFSGFSGDFEMILMRFKRISIIFEGFEGIFRKFRWDFDGIVRGC